MLFEQTLMGVGFVFVAAIVVWCWQFPSDEKLADVTMGDMQDAKCDLSTLTCLVEDDLRFQTRVQF